MSLLDTLKTKTDSSRMWIAVSVTAVFSIGHMLMCIYVFDDYGLGLFFFTPLFIGGGTTIIYGHKRTLT